MTSWGRPGIDASLGEFVNLLVRAGGWQSI
jgi:hypothetical protein